MSKEQELREKARKKNEADKEKIQNLAKDYKALVLEALDLIIDETTIELGYVDIILNPGDDARLKVKTNVQTNCSWRTKNIVINERNTKLTLQFQSIEIDMCLHADARAFKEMKKLFKGVEGFKVKAKGYSARVRMYVPELS